MNGNILSGRDCFEWHNEVPTETPQGFWPLKAFDIKNKIPVLFCNKVVARLP